MTREKAFSGTKSYKLDVSFQEPYSSCDFAIPLEDIPATGTLQFSGMIRVEQALPKSRGILALDFSYWPCKTEGYSGDRSFPWNVQSAEWVKITADLPDRAHAHIEDVSEEFWPAEPTAPPLACRGSRSSCSPATRATRKHKEGWSSTWMTCESRRNGRPGRFHKARRKAIRTGQAEGAEQDRRMGRDCRQGGSGIEFLADSPAKPKLRSCLDAEAQGT